MAQAAGTIGGSKTYAAPTYHEIERKNCVRCGIRRKVKTGSAARLRTGLCRDCYDVDPTFGQEERDAPRSA